PVFVGSTSTSIWRSKRYAARPPNIRFVKKVEWPSNASSTHSLSNVFATGVTRGGSRPLLGLRKHLIVDGRVLNDVRDDYGDILKRVAQANLVRHLDAVQLAVVGQGKR